MKQNEQPRPFRVRRAGLFLLAVALAMPGCASIVNFTAMRSIPVAGPENPVVDFSCIWQQGEGRDEHGKPCRGFCGQVMFMTAGHKKPALVRGAVSVYVFDNVGTLADQTKPFQTFEFTADEWAGFQRRTNLGMTYQLFIPYTRSGGREADCQLHMKFTPDGSGSPIFSHPETISLRGTSGASAMASAIDRKLTSSSLLFQNPAVMNPEASSAAYNELMRKMQADAASPPVFKASPRNAAVPSRQAEIERLQAVLDAASTRQVQQAAHEADPDDPRRVSQADYEEQSR
ncbi:hypothetical protein Pan44_09800 [Caulifigura coniformis]|uniref:Uncharacterized protein n=1 Tax=Caulifigura coniformis TaxID=2527983 RepID=A0A517SA58_9PLAN|nr:hypothetical protein [Caulifigura coniformis]QDT52966.1 hypothetical protein Pan44_09800 [Caulifigura coniformis]